jgi:hypothetical protein
MTSCCDEANHFFGYNCVPKGSCESWEILSLWESGPPRLGLVLELVDQHNDFYSQPGRSFSIAVSWETIFPLAHTCVASSLIL